MKVLVLSSIQLYWWAGSSPDDGNTDFSLVVVDLIAVLAY